MAETATKLPVKNEKGETAAVPGSPWRSLENLRQEMERMFDDFRFDLGWSPFRRTAMEPFWRRELSWGAMPAIDITEKDDRYEITAEVPGIDAKDIEVKYSSGMVTINGTKSEEKEEKKKDYHLSERRYGSFQRSFSLPEGVDADKIEADFEKGILKVTLPKSAEAQSKERKVAIKAK